MPWTSRTHLSSSMLSAFCLSAALGISSAARSESRSYGITSPSDTHQIRSRFVDQVFEINVWVPSGTEAGKRLPVLYLTDADGNFEYLLDFSRSLQKFKFIEPFILVGIGYPGDAETSNWLNLRARDLLYFPDYKSQPRSDAELPKDAYKGAPKFLQFIREELIPFIDKTYPTVAGDRGYAGGSGGGYFGLYVMFNAPNTFDKYIVVSPLVSSAGMGDMNAVDMAKRFAESRRPLEAKVYLSVGSEEQFAPVGTSASFVSSAYTLVQVLKSSGIAGLDLKFEVLQDEYHATGIWGFNRGLRHVYASDCQSYKYPQKVCRE